MDTSVFEKPRADFMRVDERGFELEYQPMANKVAEHLGALFYQNVFHEGDALSHRQLCNWVGAAAVRLIPDTSMRQWSTSVDDRQELEDVLWAKAIWSLVHVLPIGFMVTKRQFQAQGYTWNPALAPLRQSTTASNSNRLFSGFPISQAVYLKLFPEALESKFSMLTFAIIDTFSSKPNTDNPFYNAIRDALRMTLITHPYPIPYFWMDFIEAFFAHNPHDMQRFKASMTRLKPQEAVSFSHHQTQQTETPQEASPVEPEEKQAEPKIETPTPTPSDTAKAPSQSSQVSNDAPVPQSNVYEQEQAFHREALREMYASWGQNNDRNVQQSLLRDIVLYWGKVTSEKVQSGKFPVNAPSAFAYVTEDHGVFITEGGLKRMLGLVNDPQVDWQSWMEHAGLIEQYAAEIKASNRVITVDAWLLRPRVQSFFIPDLDTYSPSEVFSVKYETAS